MVTEEKEAMVVMEVWVAMVVWEELAGWVQAGKQGVGLAVVEWCWWCCSQRPTGQ